MTQPSSLSLLPRRNFLARLAMAPIALIVGRNAIPSEPAPLDFVECCNVRIDLCRIGVAHARSVWIDRIGSLPTVLWVTADELSFANDLLTRYRSPLVALVEPRYTEGQWSVGTRRSYGFGSMGS